MAAVSKARSTLLGAILAAAACGDDGSSGTTTSATHASEASEAGPGSGGDPTAAPTGDPTGDPGPSTGPAPGSGDSTATATASTGSADDGDGVPCTSNTDCGTGEYCEFADDSCGVSGVAGSCQQRPEGCGTDERPVCGCDGQLHASLCQAAGSGQDVDFLGECELPNGGFPCGFSFCILGDEYCLEQGGPMPTFECIALPPVCQPPDCSCITTCCGCANASCCSDFCSNVDEALTYTCPGT